jgi:hypothetical protein
MIAGLDEAQECSNLVGMDVVTRWSCPGLVDTSREIGERVRYAAPSPCRLPA